MKRLLIATSIFLSMTIPSLAAKFSHLKSEIISISGEINHGDEEQFKALLSKYPKTRGVVLDSPGGYVDEGLNMALVIHTKKLTTYIVKDAQCVSICSLLFFSGKHRYISANGHLGVHTAFDETTRKRDDKTNALIAWYLGYLGYDVGLIDLWLSAEPDSMNTITDKINRDLNLGIEIIN